MDAHVPNFARKASKYTIPPPASPIPRIVLKSPTISSTTPPIQESKDYGLPPTTPTTLTILTNLHNQNIQVLI